MPPRPESAATVLLAGADAAAVAALQPSAETLAEFGIAVETVVAGGGGLNSALFDGKCAVIVASPDGVMPAAAAAATELPVIRVPIVSAERKGLELFSDETGDLPSALDGSVFATMAIGVAGAKNAALFVVAVLALRDERLRAQYVKFRAGQTEAVLNQPPLES